jgi:hypothetical protein
MITKSELRKLFATDIKHCMEPGVCNGSEIRGRRGIIKERYCKREIPRIVVESDFETQREMKEETGCEIRTQMTISCTGDSTQTGWKENGSPESLNNELHEYADFSLRVSDVAVLISPASMQYRLKVGKKRREYKVIHIIFIFCYPEFVELTLKSIHSELLMFPS